MTNIQKVVGIVLVLVLIGGTYLLARNTKDTPGIFGDIGTNPVENYIPIIKYNEGYYSELPLTSTGLGSFGSIKVSTSGTAIDGLFNGTCSLSLATGNSDFTIAATTTEAFDCATTGSVLGDTVLIQTATSSIATSGGFAVESVSASTTAGSSRVHIRNNTGASAILPASVASSTKWTVLSQ